MTFQKIFIFQKIKDILSYLKEAEPLFKFSDEEILGDSYKFHTAERILQLIVDATIDINQHFIRELDLKSVDDLQGTFYVLGENKIIPQDFAQKLAPAVGLRNRIVHRYEELDKELFIKTFRKDYLDFKAYISFISKYLEK